MPDMKFGISAIGQAPMQTTVTARSFTMIIDEPLNLGGGDAGPNPVETMMAALAGCLNVVGHIVAREMGFALRDISIAIEGVLNPARFMGQPSEDRAGFKEIRVTLRPAADADAATLTRWMHTVESRCPVSDNLSAATPVHVALG